MNKFDANKTARLSALQISASIILISTSAILFASSVHGVPQQVLEPASVATEASKTEDVSDATDTDALETPNACGSFSNSAPIIIPSSGTSGTGSPYPSNIVVSGLGGAITKVTVSLSGFSHGRFSDTDVLLVGPQGQSAIILSDVGGNSGGGPFNLTLDDAAPSLLRQI